MGTKYARAVDRYMQEQPQGWNQLKNSTSLNTDGYVLHLLRYTGHHGPQFQRDVVALVRWVWTRAMHDTPGMPEAMNREQQRQWLRLRDPNAVMHDLVDERSPEYYQRVYRMKQHYLASNRNWRPCVTHSGGLSACCSVLTCWNPVHNGKGLLLNSMHYCWPHRGLALINGLRHSPESFCDMCAVWTVL